MVGGLGNLTGLFKQAKDLQQKFGDIQSELQATRHDGEAGGGAGVATVNGKGTLVDIKIQPDAAGDGEPAGLAEALPHFDHDVRAMALRAQEVHCTEEGFNAAIMARADELIAGGAGGELLIAIARERGLGSLDENKGGLIRIPTR